MIKTVDNGDGGTAVAGEWTMNVTGTNPGLASFPGEEAGTSITLDVGGYGVAESEGPPVTWKASRLIARAPSL